jgi:hypothetical protein
MERLEVRTDKLISFKDITHFEVPLSNVKETEDILKLNNVSVPVIPLEFGEVYCSSFPFKELVGIK